MTTPTNERDALIEDARLKEFEAAMVEAGYHKPQRNSIGDGYLYERDADRYVGWQAARATPLEEQKPVACYMKAYGVQLLKAGLMAYLPDNTLLYLHPSSTTALVARNEALEALLYLQKHELWVNGHAKAVIASAISAALKAVDVPKADMPSDTEMMFNQMQFGADMVTKYNGACKEVKRLTELMWECRNSVIRMFENPEGISNAPMSIRDELYFLKNTTGEALAASPKKEGN